MHEILIYCSKNNALTYLKIEHKILNINIFCAFQQTLINFYAFQQTLYTPGLVFHPTSKSSDWIFTIS